jgi:uncharacterized secreted protein with C-terminal beta-propeller domain
MAIGKNKGILIGIVAIICIGLLIAGIVFPVFNNGPEDEPQDIVLDGTPLTTYDDTVIEPGTNKLQGLTNEDWFSELLEDEELDLNLKNVGETEFNSSGENNRDLDGGNVYAGGEEEKSSTSLESDDLSAPTSSQMPREIEEADIIKLVDDTLYILNTYRGFMIIDVSDPDEPYIKSRVPLFGYPVEMYVVEPRAYVVLTHYYNAFLWAEDGDAVPEYRHGSEIVVLDIQDLTKPTVEKYIELDGFISDTRRVGEVIYAVANYYDYGYYVDGIAVDTIRISTDDMVLESNDMSSTRNMEIEVSEEETKEGSTESSESSEVSEFEPVQTPTGKDDDEEPYIEEPEETEGIVVISINFEDLTNVVEIDRAKFPGTSNHIHVTEEAIFVAQPKYEYYNDPYLGYKSRYYTKITYVDISDYHGKIEVRDTFTVDGYLEDRYQMDSYDSTFRIVTHFWGERGELGTSKLWIFDTSNPDEITKKGELLIDDAGTLMATRFAGDRAYTIHLPHSVDPLDVIDLSNPSKPVLTDILEMPGWVTYMEVRGYKILALGVDDSDDQNKVAVSLFDVSDPYNAVMEDRVKIGDGYSWSTANWDPKALTVVDDQNLVLVPFESYSYDENSKYNSFSGLQIVEFDLEKGDLTAGGAIEQMGTVQRTRANDERIFAISYKQLQVIDAGDINKPKITAKLELCNNIIDIIPMGDHAVQIVSEYDYNKGRSTTKLRTVKASEPDTSIFISEEIIELNVLRFYTNDDLLYLVVNKIDWQSSTGNTGCWVLVYDYSDPAKPVKLSEFEIEEYKGEYYRYYWGYYDYYGGYQSQPSFLDYNFVFVNDETLVYHPSPEYNYWEYPEEVYDDNVDDKYDEENSTDIRDENTTNPEAIEEKEEPAYYYYYPTTYNEVFYFIDLSDPNAPVAAGNLTIENTSQINGMFAKGTNLYFIQYQDSSYYDEYSNWQYQVKYFLSKVDLIKVTEPKMVNKLNIPGTVVGMSDDQSILFTQSGEYDEEYNWKQTLNVLELNNDKATLVTELDLSDNWPSILVQDTTIIITYNVYSNYYYEDTYYGAKVKDENQQVETSIKTKIQIIDASNPRKLTLDATLGLKNYGSVYKLENGKLYIMLSNSGGLTIYDLADSSEPVFKGYFPTYGYVNSIREDVTTGRIYLVCGQYGVLLVELE